MIEFLKKNWFVIVLALVLGAMMIVPYFYFREKTGAEFKGIWPGVVDDEMFYYARVKDVVDGHPFLSNAYLAEHKGGLPQQVFLAEWLLAQPIKFLNISINTAHLAYNFLLPIASFILTYFALYLISKSRFLSVAFSTFLFFGLYLMAFIRPVSPQFNFIFWLTQFIFLWLLINNANDKKKLRMLLIANIVNFGFLFYIYPYYWTFYLIFFGILAAVYFIKDRALSFKVAAIASGGLILAIPYFYLNYLAAQLPYYTETLTRLGLIYSRFPSGARIIFWSFWGLTAIAFFFWRRLIKADVQTLFFVSGIFSSMIAANQHLITGRNLEFTHYEMAAIFFLVFTASYLVSNLKYQNKLIAPAAALVILTAIFIGWPGYSGRAFDTDKNYVYYQNYAPVFDWLNKNTEKDSVVFANEDLSRLIPVYTANNIFYIRETNLFFISDEEILDRFILNNYFENFDQDFVTKNVRSIYGVRYIDEYGHAVQANKLRWLLGLKTEPEIYLPEEAALKAIKRAAELQRGDFAVQIKRYRTDYLIWDKNRNPDWQVSPEFFRPVFKHNGIGVYETNF